MNEEFNKLFNKLMRNAQTFAEQTKNQTKEKAEEYVPKPITQSTIPEYKSLRVGPKPLTIEKYKKRQEERKLKFKEAEKITTEKKKKTRAGKRVQRKKEIDNLHRIIPIATGDTKHQFINKLKELKKLQYGRPSNQTDRLHCSKTGGQPF